MIPIEGEIGPIGDNQNPTIIYNIYKYGSKISYDEYVNNINTINKQLSNKEIIYEDAYIEIIILK